MLNSVKQFQKEITDNLIFIEGKLAVEVMFREMKCKMNRKGLLSAGKYEVKSQDGKFKQKLEWKKDVFSIRAVPTGTIEIIRHSVMGPEIGETRFYDLDMLKEAEAFLERADKKEDPNKLNWAKRVSKNYREMVGKQISL